jgi:hypothetical protein
MVPYDRKSNRSAFQQSNSFQVIPENYTTNQKLIYLEVTLAPTLNNVVPVKDGKRPELVMPAQKRPKSFEVHTEALSAMRR